MSMFFSYSCMNVLRTVRTNNLAYPFVFVFWRNFLPRWEIQSLCRRQWGTIHDAEDGLGESPTAVVSPWR